MVTQFATAKAGLILVNINPAYRLARARIRAQQGRLPALITATSFKTSDYLGMLRELAPELDRSAPGALEAARLPQLGLVIRIGDDEPPACSASTRCRRSAAERAARRARASCEPTLQFDDPINIQFTSGTTGRPRARR